MKIPITRANLFSTILFVLSGLLVIVTIMFTMNVQVLRNWKLILPTTEVHAGDTLTIESQYTKLKNVSGKATRYLECKNQNGVFIKYPLNERVADHPAGTGGTGVVLKIPTDTIPSLPAVCRISITIVYKVYPWRSVPEHGSTGEFQLLPPRSSADGS